MQETNNFIPIGSRIRFISHFKKYRQYLLLIGCLCLGFLSSHAQEARPSNVLGRVTITPDRQVILEEIIQTEPQSSTESVQATGQNIFSQPDLSSFEDPVPSTQDQEWDASIRHNPHYPENESRAQPDLNFKAGTASLTITGGTSISLGLTIQNGGTASASYSYVGYYLSTNTTISTADYLIGQDYVAALAVGGTSAETFSTDVATNGTIPAGTYYVGFYIDYTFRVAESNETNNPRYWSTPNVSKVSTPDLTRQSSGTSLTVAGTTLDVSVVVINNGSGTASYSYLGYYLSLDNNINTSDYFLSSDYVPSLGPGATSTETYNTDIAGIGGIPAGTYYVGFIIDYTGLVTESNENNNTFYFISPKITKAAAQPDLTLKTASSSISVSGTNVNYNIVVENIGSGSAVYSYVGYYLSSDVNITTGDYYIGEDYVSSLASGGTSTETHGVDVAGLGTIPAGTYYVALIIDYTYRVAESNENNNQWYFPNPKVTIAAAQPDYRPKNFYVSPSNVTPGSSVTGSVKAENIGGGAGTINVSGKYYFSTNTTLDGGDTELGVDDIEPLSPGQETPESEALTIPSWATAGNYYILYKVDASNQLTESDENNNVAYYAITVSVPTYPDLVVHNAALSSSNVPAGNTINLSCRVNNIGNGYAGVSKLGYYLSSNTSWDGSDTYIGEDLVSDLGAGSGSNEDISYTIPGGTPSGTYYILFVADYQYAVNESDENNNVAYKTLYVQVAGNPPIANFSANVTSICQNGDVYFTDLSANNPTSWSWNITGGSYSYINGTSSASQNPQVRFQSAGNYNISLTATNAFGSDTKTINSYINVSAAAVPSVSIAASANAVCVGTNIVFTANPVNGGATPSYQWKVNSVAVGTNSPSYSSSSLIHGDVVTCTMTSSLACASTTVANSNSISVVIYAQPNVTLAAYSSPCVTDAPYALTGGSPAGGTYSGTGVSGGQFNPAVAGVGTHVITYTYVDIYGCSNSAQQSIVVQASCSPFTWTPTNLSGLFQGQAQIGNIPAQANDWIAAFDQSGNCAGAAPLVVNGGKAFINLPIYGDDPTTPTVDEGINAGENFKLVLYDASHAEYLEYPYTNNPVWFNQWMNTNGTPIPAYNDQNQIYNFLRVSVQTDVINLRAGWNLISLDVQPTDPSIASVFSGLQANNLEYVTGFEQGSLIYDPNAAAIFNTLTHVKNGYGYWVKVAFNDQLIVTGLPIDPSFKRDLDDGWNLVGYIPQTASTPSIYYQNLITSNNLVYVTGFENGTLYFDPYGLPIFNTLHNVKNGGGYWLRVLNGVNGHQYRKGSELGITPTPNYFFLNGSSNLPESAIGKFVEVLDQRDKVVAKMEVLEGGYLMTTPVYGDDASTQLIDGVEEGSDLRFRFEGMMANSTVSFESAGEAKRLNLAFNSMEEITIFPSPFKDELTVVYELSKAAESNIWVRDMYGREVAHIRQGYQDAGIYEYKWSVPQMPEGIYLITVEVDGKILSKKRVLHTK